MIETYLTHLLQENPKITIFHVFHLIAYLPINLQYMLSITHQ